LGYPELGENQDLEAFQKRLDLMLKEVRKVIFGFAGRVSD
jgi:hypothetical protein